MGELLTRREAADFLRIGMGTLERWSREKYGPKPFHLSSGRVVYRRADLVSWVNACEAQEKECASAN